jgi:hydroxyethylthiazole kinase
VKVYDLLLRVKEEKPLIHHLTNWVTIGDCAHVTKAFGASPVMAHAKEEVEEMAQLADSLVLNIGTLTVDLIESMKLAAIVANKKKIPVVLDVCGAGATRLRQEQCCSLIRDVKVDIIKGNASEIATMAGYQIQTKGVETGVVSRDLMSLAKELAVSCEATVVITGSEDIVVDKQRTAVVRNGHSMMGDVVGTGCMSTSAVGVFAAIEKDLFYAVFSALCCFEIAGELAAEGSKSPGFFRQKLLEEIYLLNEKMIIARQKVFL